MPSVTERRPTRPARTAVYLLLWLVAGVFCYANYYSDAPPKVAHREAMIEGLLAPLMFAGAIGSNPVQLPWYVAIGYLSAWLALTYFTFSGTRIGSFVMVIALLIGLYLAGGHYLIYMNEHSGG